MMKKNKLSFLGCTGESKKKKKGERRKGEREREEEEGGRKKESVVGAQTFLTEMNDSRF